MTKDGNIIKGENIGVKACSVIASHYLNQPLKNKWIFYDSFNGLGALCNPRAIFKRLLENKDFDDYKHIWVVEDYKKSAGTVDEFANYDNVIFVRKNSKEHAKYVSTAKYIIANTTMPSFFVRREGQIYLNTWHGVPTKSMGYERPGQRIRGASNVVRNFLGTTHLISANRFVTDTMYKNAYMLDELYDGKFLEVGHPRTDAVLNTERDYVLNKLNELGIRTDKKIIMYAPTWKGSLWNKLEFNLDEFKNIIKSIKSQIDTDEYEVYLRVHYFLYKQIEMDEELKKITIPFTIDTNELLSVVDILISDYSSIFFDYLVTDRPILFYMPDLDDYNQYRGLYIPLSELPGPVTKDIDEIASYINHIDEVKHKYRTNYDAMKAWCTPQDDGNVCDRVIDIIFKGEERQGEIQVATKSKKRILIVSGWKALGHAQNRLKNILSWIDYDRYDVTLVSQNPKKEVYINNLQSIDDNVRIIARSGRTISSKEEAKHWSQLRKLFYKTDDIESLYNEIPYDMLEREWQRVAGGVSFDKVILYNAATPFWRIFSTIIPARKRAIVDWNIYDDIDISEEGYSAGSVKLNNTIYSNKKYDDIIVSNPHLLDDEQLREIYANHNVIELPCPINRRFTEIQDAELIFKEATYKNKHYSVISNNQASNGDTLLIPAFDETYRNFIVVARNIRKEDYINLLKAFIQVQSSKQKIRLYIFDTCSMLKREIKILRQDMGDASTICYIPFQKLSLALFMKCDCYITPFGSEAEDELILLSKLRGMDCIQLDEKHVSDKRDIVLPETNILMTPLEDIFEMVDVPQQQYLEVESEQSNKVADETVVSDFASKIEKQLVGELYNDGPTFDPELFNKNAMDQFEALFD